MCSIIIVSGGLETSYFPLSEGSELLIKRSRLEQSSVQMCCTVETERYFLFLGGNQPGDVSEKLEKFFPFFGGPDRHNFRRHSDTVAFK